MTAWCIKWKEPIPAITLFLQRVAQRLSLIKHLDDKDGLKQFPFTRGALESEAQLGHQDTGCFSVILEGQGWCVLHQGAALLLVPHPAAKKPPGKPVFSTKPQDLAGLSGTNMEIPFTNIKHSEITRQIF